MGMMFYKVALFRGVKQYASSDYSGKERKNVTIVMWATPNHAR